MCLVAPGQITSIDGSTGFVVVDGRLRSVSIALEPDAAIGDWVVVIGSVVVRRVAPASAEEMQAAVKTIYPEPEFNRRSSEGSPL